MFTEFNCYLFQLLFFFNITIKLNLKLGWLKKRAARLHRWSTRYFILSGAKLSYKLKHDTDSFRGSFDLVSGCITTEVNEEFTYLDINSSEIDAFCNAKHADSRRDSDEGAKNL
jgi:hypothetical protein